MGISFVTVTIYMPQWRAKRLVKYKQSIVNVLYEEGKRESTSVVRELKSSLIGSTEKVYVFFMTIQKKRTIVIPITKIISITTNKK